MEKWLTDGHGHLIAATHGRATLDSAEAAIRGALAGRYDAVAAAPHTESAIHAAGFEFDG